LLQRFTSLASPILKAIIDVASQIVLGDYAIFKIYSGIKTTGSFGERFDSFIAGGKP